jgi:LPXTG-motif cell wall-anchored protein
MIFHRSCKRKVFRVSERIGTETLIPKTDKGEHEMNSRTSWTRALLVLFVGVLCAAFTLSMSAQVQTKTTTTSGAPTVTTHVEKGEIVFVSGNSVVVKMADGTLRHFDNVPESARVTVNGQQLGVHDLKAGMKVEKTITTSTTPETITTVKSVTGKVWFVNPPSTVILTLEDGKNQEFKIPNGQKFDVDGQMVDAWGLKKGMTVSATKVVETPTTVIAQKQKLTGEMPPPPPPPPPADVPILVVEEVQVAPVQVAQAAPAPVLPKTGSELPLVGLLGLLSLASSLGLRTARKSR